MRPLTTPELMAAWDTASGLEPYARPLALLAAACPEHSGEELARLTVGERDGLLLTLREWALGAGVVALADGPACEQRVELAFCVEAVRAPAGAAADTLAVSAGGYELVVRPPNA